MNHPLTHLDSSGHARMVDVTDKTPTVRSATAAGRVITSPRPWPCCAMAPCRRGCPRRRAHRRDPGGQEDPDLLPLAHVIGVHGAVVDLVITDAGVDITATVRTADRTGVEMEALTSVSVAALTVIDMVKGRDRSAHMTDIRLLEKTGGRSGTWIREDS